MARGKARARMLAWGCGGSLLFTAAVCLCAQLTGALVPPFLPGGVDQGGARITKAQGGDQSCRFSVGLLRSPAGPVVYLGRSAPRIDPRKGRWLVIDHLVLPRLTQKQQILLDCCEQQGVMDETIVAVVDTTETEWLLTSVRRAFRADLATGRLEPISTGSIRCLNPSWGL